MRRPLAFGGLEAIAHARRLGAGVAARAVVGQAWSVKRELELVCSLPGRPPRPSAKIPIAMVETEPETFRGFDDELALADGVEYGQALRRVLVCRAAIRGLHVARSEGGTPAYAQWLLGPDDRNRLRRRLPGPWRALDEDEVIVEFAYTFTEHRGKGVMAAGMGALLDIAAERGASTAYTYVRADNVPSLRGCAKVGFRPTREVSTTFRLGFHRVGGTPLDHAATSGWERAVAPRS